MTKCAAAFMAACLLLASAWGQSGRIPSTSTNESITGKWTYSQSPAVPAPTNPTDAANKSYADTKQTGDPNCKPDGNGNQTCSGTGTFGALAVGTTVTTPKVSITNTPSAGTDGVTVDYVAAQCSASGETTTLLLADGTVGAPVISYASQPNMGYYRAGTNTEAFAVLGRPRIAWSYLGIFGGSDSTFGWAEDDWALSPKDTGISRHSAAYVRVGNGTQDDASGTIEAAHFISPALGTAAAATLGNAAGNAWQTSAAHDTACVSPNGVKCITLTGQTAGISKTTLYTPAAAGTYRVSFVLWMSAVATAGTISVSTYGNTGVATAADAGVGSGSITATGLNSGAGTGVFYVGAGQNISYAVFFTGITGSPQYGVSISVERLQ